MKKPTMRLVKWILAAALSAAVAHAYVVHYDDSGVYVIKWQTSPVTMQVKLATARNLSDGNSQVSSVQAAMQIWNAQLASQQLVGQTASTVGGAQQNGVNEIVMDSQVQGKALGSGVLAITAIYDMGDSITETDLTFNNAYTWDSYRGLLRADEDIQRVALHELGHVLGLDHPDEAGQNVSAIMNSHESDIDSLQFDDISGAQLLYGRAGFTPANDNFAAATALTGSGPTIQVNGSNIGATRETGEPNEAGAAGSHSVWWKWTAPIDGSARVTTLGSNFDTVLGVYTGSSLVALTEVGSNDDEEAPSQNSTSSRKRTSAVSFAISKGTTYYFAVDGFAGAAVPGGYTGSITLNLGYGVPPKIIAQSGNVSVDFGGTAQFWISVTGDAPLTYQWYKGTTPLADGGNITGAKAVQLQISSAQTADAAGYSVKVTNAAGAVTSADINLVVATPPALANRPLSKVVAEGQPVSLAVTASGSDSLTYVWKHNRQVISGATSATLSIGAAAVADQGYYEVTVTNAAGGVAYSVVYLGVAISHATIATWGDYSVPPPSIDGSMVAICDGQPSAALKGDGTVVLWGVNSAMPDDVKAKFTGIVAISVGQAGPVAALKGDGTVVVWDYNNWAANQPPANLANVVAISAGRNFITALKSDGSVVTWGGAAEGETTLPGGLQRVAAISSANMESLALRSDGSVVMWGSSFGYTDQLPVNLGDIVAISIGSLNRYALRSDGSTIAWGNDYAGSLAVPASLTNAVAVVAGNDFGLGLKPDGTVVAWGRPYEHQLNIPAGLSNVVAISARDASMALSRSTVPTFTLQPKSLTVTNGDYASFSVTASGTVPLTYQWRFNGRNLADGGIISGATTSRLQIADAETANAGSYDVVVTDAAGSVTSTPATLVVNQAPIFTARPLSRVSSLGQSTIFVAAATDNKPITYQWRHNRRVIAAASSASLTVSSLTLADSGTYEVIASNGVAESHSVCTLQVVSSQSSNATLQSWGTNQYGQYGPSAIPGDLNQVVGVAAGQDHAVAVRADGTVRAWGVNNFGPTSVPAGLNDVVAVAAGAYSTLVLRADGTLLQWGSYSGNPVQPPADLRDVISISTRGINNIALKSDGTVVTWPASPIPAGLGDVIAISAGAGHFLVLKSDGSVVAWGGNSDGETNVPVNLAGVVSVAAGDNHSLALKADGTVVAWGRNDAGQCTVPSGLQGVIAISAGFVHSIALRQDGSAVGWGRNNEGEVTSQPASLNIEAISSGSYYNLMLVAAVSPSVTVDPADVQVTAPNQARFSAVINGANLTYQWRKDGVPLSDNARILGSATPILTISGTLSADAGRYDLVATNSLGTITSRAALLTVNIPPTFAQRPGSRIVGIGQPFTLSAQVSDPGPVSYIWTHNGRTIAGATGSTLTIGATSLADGGWYRLTASNAAATSSAIAYVRVTPVDPSSTRVITWGPGVGTLPVPTSLNGHTIDVAAGQDYSVALKDDGSLTVWGIQSSFNPGVSGAAAVSAATDHFLALLADGTVGQYSAIYASLQTMTGIHDAVAVAAGTTTNYALLVDGTVESWPTAQPTAVATVTGYAHVAQIAAGANTLLALKDDGAVLAMVPNGDPLLAIPPGVTEVRGVAANQDTSMVLKANGTVVSWGHTDLGDQLAPTGLNHVIALAAFGQHAIAVKSDGTVTTWGILYSSVLDGGPSQNSGIIAAAAGMSHGVAIVGQTAAPLVFAGEPVDVTTLPGSSVTFDSGGAITQVPVSYQWQALASGSGTWDDLNDGARYRGSLMPSLTILGIDAGMDGTGYRCVATAGATGATSGIATLSVVATSPFVGAYFGTFASDPTARWAMYVNRSGAATFIAYLGGRGSAVVLHGTVSFDGLFSVAGSEFKPADAAEPTRTPMVVGEDRVPQAVGASFTLVGQIQPDGSALGQLTGLNLAFSGNAEMGAGSSPEGVYTASGLGNVGGAAYAVVAADGTALVVTAIPQALDASTSPVGADGKLSATTLGGGQLDLSINAAAGSLQGTLIQADGGAAVAVAGLADGVASTARLVNISSRAAGGTGNNVAIGGFVVAGTAPKRLLLRAVGPTLTTAGIGPSEVMLDPTIELHDALHGNSIVTTVDNWGDNANAGDIVTVAGQIGASALAGSDSRSAAALLTVQPGVYSFIAQGKNGTAGIVLVEVYDADTASPDAKLANISTRAYSATGDSVTIGGFVVTGNAPKHVLLRAVGPTLSTQGLGVSEVLQDPTIEVHDALHGNTVIATNDNWGDSGNAPSITSTGARLGATPLATSDTTSSAMLITLQPGVYSFVAQGKNGTSGIVLVEVYDAD